VLACFFAVEIPRALTLRGGLPLCEMVSYRVTYWTRGAYVPRSAEAGLGQLLVAIQCTSVNFVDCLARHEELGDGCISN
jgi:hypothetical protein